MRMNKNFIGKLWALPTTFIGIFIGFVGLCIAPRKIRIMFAHNAICFYNHPFMHGRAIALTLGNVILFLRTDDFLINFDTAGVQ